MRLRNPWGPKGAQATICLLCLFLDWGFSSGLEGTEFSGGNVTGPLLDLFDIGEFLFLAALVLTIFLRKASAAITVLAALISFPLYLYLIVPGPFRRALPGEYSVPLRSNFEWHFVPVSHAILLLVAIGVGTWGFLDSARARNLS